MYFVTCFEKIDKNNLGYIDIGCFRVLGYFDTFQEADNALKQNMCDIYEGVYNFASIENISSGFYRLANKTWYYEFNENKDGYVQIKKPEEFKNYGNIAFG